MPSYTLFWDLVWFLILQWYTCFALSSFSSRNSASSEQSSSPHRYVALYKPPLVLCSFRDDQFRADRKHREPRITLNDLDLPTGLHYVGRLDRDSEGLLLLTDDGQFTRDVCEPKYDSKDDDMSTRTRIQKGCPKRYWALVRGGIPNENALEGMRRGGLTIRGATTLPPESVELLSSDVVQEANLPLAAFGMDQRPRCVWMEIILTEGRNRQVRRITADAGHPTVRLVRMSVGNWSILNSSGDDLALQPGEWCFIRKEEVLGEQ